MKNCVIFLIAFSVILFAFGANAQEEGKEAEKKDPCGNITCSHHGVCVVRYIEEHAVPTCACDEGYTPDTVNGLSCQPVNQPAPQPKPPAAPPQDAQTKTQPLSHPEPGPTAKQPKTKDVGPYSSEYFPYNQLSHKQLKRVLRNWKIVLSVNAPLAAGSITLAVFGTIYYSVPMMIIGYSLLVPTIVLTIISAVKIVKLKQYIVLRGYANLQNPYLAIRDETITQFAF